MRFLQVSRGDIHETQREEMHQAQSFSHRTNVKDTIIFRYHSFPFYNPNIEDVKHLHYIHLLKHQQCSATVSLIQPDNEMQYEHAPYT